MIFSSLGSLNELKAQTSSRWYLPSSGFLKELFLKELNPQYIMRVKFDNISWRPRLYLGGYSQNYNNWQVCRRYINKHLSFLSLWGQYSKCFVQPLPPPKEVYISVACVTIHSHDPPIGSWHSNIAFHWYLWSCSKVSHRPGNKSLFFQKCVLTHLFHRSYLTTKHLINPEQNV